MSITWGEFKKQVEAQGVKDYETIAYIDFDSVSSSNRRVEVEHTGGRIAIS